MLHSNTTPAPSHQMTHLTPTEYLQADIASNFGIKGQWQTRLDWFQNHEKDLNKLITDSADPALFFAGIKAWELVKAGKPSGYTILLDASASGLQWLSLLSGCIKSALQCNVLPTGDCEDVYMNIYTLLSDPTLYQTIQGLTRKELKNVIMTALYGSIKEPENLFKLEKYVDSFLQCMADAVPGAWELKDEMLGLWNPNALSYDWVMPDGFNVIIPVMAKIDHTYTFLGSQHTIRIEENAPVWSSRSLGPNIVHNVDGFIAREIIMRCSAGLKKKFYTPVNINYHNPDNIKMVDKLWGLYLKSGILSSRILMYLDRDSRLRVDMNVVETLVQTLPDVAFPVTTIHDAFRCIPNYAQDMRRQYNQLMYEVSKSDLLQFILRQFDDPGLIYEKTDKFPHEDILNSDYAIH